MRLTRVKGFACFAAVLVLSLAAQALQQKGEDPNVRSLEGVVSDAADAPVNGAVVQLKNTKTLQVRSFITQKDGRYHFQGLSTNADYEVKAQAGADFSKTRTLSSFSSRKRVILDLKIESSK